MHGIASFVVALIAYATVADAHARVTSPPIRTPGQNHLQKCGQASFQRLNLDPTGHIEEQQPVNPGCELTVCRGMLFSDQPASNIQRVVPGQAMTMDVDCTIPHGGPANVTLLDTTAGGAGRVIGSFLKTFDNFCPVPGPAPADQTKLQFSLPNSQAVGSSCQKDGQCVVQLFWATPDFSQNYYYCVDVTMKAAVAAPSTIPAPVPSQSTPVVVRPPATSQAQTTPVVATPPVVVSQTKPVVAAPPVVVTQSQPVVATPPVVVTQTQPVVAASSAAPVAASSAAPVAAPSVVPVAAPSAAPVAVPSAAPVADTGAASVASPVAAATPTRMVTVQVAPTAEAALASAPEPSIASSAGRRRRVLWFSF